MKSCGLFALALILLQAVYVVGVDYEDYDYGDRDLQFDSVHKVLARPVTQRGSFSGHELPVVPLAVRGAGESSAAGPSLPLCCPENQISDFGKCVPAPASYSWRPRLDGAYNAPLEYKGWPRCRNQGNNIAFYQRDVHFDLDEGSVILPFHVQLESVKAGSYCITKVSEQELSGCEDFQTQIYACINEEESTPWIIWASVSISHFLMVLTLIVFFFMSEYRCLQGNYMICFLISLLIYNVCLFPGSNSSMNIGDVACIALGAVKYFFFCGIFLWFKMVCFDVWRSIKSGVDLGNRKRFLSFSAFCWITSIVLASIVLALPYASQSMNENSRNDPLRETNFDTCKLKMGVDIILQIAQMMSMIIDLVFLVLATVAFYGYSSVGNGLQRCQASMCLKMAWKLYIIMVAHVLSCVDSNFLTLPVPMWQFVLLESTAIFGVLAYRKTVIRWASKGACFASWLCPQNTEEGNLQEKGQLTMT